MNATQMHLFFFLITFFQGLPREHSGFFQPPLLSGIVLRRIKLYYNNFPAM